MYSCIICHFDVELDDVAVAGGARSCVCLRCYARETDSELPMPKQLRRELTATLAGIGVA
jgi:hypothetical protein